MHKPPCVIFDIDGTIADCSHRLHFLPDYDKFFAAMSDDTPIWPVIKLVNLFETALEEEEEDRPAAIFVSGRPERYRKQTVDWMSKYIGSEFSCEKEVGLGGYWFPCDLYMRKDGDHRPDHIIKNEIRQEIEQRYTISLVIDDRPRVVSMWRAAGYVCLQNEWHGDATPKYHSGKLTIMVGPAGAGKDHYLNNTSPSAAWKATTGTGWQRVTVVSSDQLRQDLCGDFRDQSKNKQVFELFHSLVKTTLEHGGNVVANSTHIKRADRLATLACAPADCEVEYVVVDRPLQDKIRDGQWRNEVRVKNMPLIEYHDQVFKSNLAQILAGDNDPRVTVKDMRHA